MPLPCNVGLRERYVRLGLAAAAGAAALSRSRSGTARFLLGTLAAAEVVTAATRYCPLNAILGIDHCRDASSRSDVGTEQAAIPEISRSAAIGGIPMRWEEHDRGGEVAVVMVHGIPTHPRLWRYVIPRVEGACCLAWEMVGFGWSIPAGLGRDVSIAAQAEYLEAWLNHLGVEQAIFVGHDLGGGVVQRFAAAHPERVLGLVLADCIAYDNWPVAPVLMGRWAAEAGLVQRLPRALLRLMLMSALQYLGHDGSDRRRESARFHCQPYDRPEGPEGFANQLRHARTRDTLEVAPDLPNLARLGIPARVVWGDHDPLGLASGRRLAQALDTPLQRLNGARHFTPEDHPEELAQAVREVITSVITR